MRTFAFGVLSVFVEISLRVLTSYVYILASIIP